MARSERNVAVAVLDYEMPAMNGCLLADYLRARDPDLKIILHSGAVAIPEEQMTSVDVFVPKGNGIQTLLAHIAELMRAGARERGRVLGLEPYAGSSRHDAL
jgi:CheY-like chemotaxis protein